MNRNLFAIAVVIASLNLLANAGTISGKVSGASGESVVYVDVVAGKTFPPPTAHPLVDQKGLMFTPHITVVQVGTTVDFQNSDSVAHNVFWTSVGGNKKLTHNLGTWPKGEKRSFKFDNPGAVLVRDSKRPAGGNLALTSAQWRSLLSGIKSGRYDLLGR